MIAEVFRVLLVDDPRYGWALEDEARATFPHAQCLQVDTESSYRTALSDFAPELVLYGLHAPAFTGVTALRLARVLAPQAAFVVVAGPPEREPAAACLWAGADDYVLRHDQGRPLAKVAAEALLRHAHHAPLTPAPVHARDGERQHVEMIGDLEHGLTKDQLRVQYHATVSLATGRVSGFEALVRWQHPRRGLLLPGEFMPAAEQSGLILPMGRWVVREACQFARGLPAGREPAPAVSVNVSGHQFRQPGFVDEVGAILRETDVRGRQMRLDVTEGVILQDIDAASQKLSRLREMGLGIDMDDFGAGYGSLTALRTLPIDAVKIDRSVIDRMGTEARDLAVVRSVVSLSRRLGIASVAEGVRTREAADQLGRIGCEYGQGFFFSPPVGAPDARGLLTRRWDSARPPLEGEEARRGFLGRPQDLPSLLDLVDRWGPGPSAD